jgi:hypothetical protein
MSHPDTSSSHRREPSLVGQGDEFTLVVLGSDDAQQPGFLLGASRLSLGAGADDDVFLTGVGVVPGHLQLIFLDGHITLLSAAEEVRIDGQAVTSYPRDLQPCQALSLSPDTHLAYGQAGSSWPAPPPWVLPEPDETFVDDGADGAGARMAEATDPTTEPVRGPVTVRERAVHGARLAAIALSAATFIVVALVVTDLVWGVREVVNPAEVSIGRSEQALRRMLDADPGSYGSVSLSVRPDGALTLTGFIDSDAAFRTLAEQVRQEDVNSRGNVRLDVMTISRLSALVKDQLARFPLGSLVDVTPSRVLVTVYGASVDAETMDRLKSDLEQLSPRLQPRRLSIRFRVEKPDKLADEVRGTLTASAVTRDLRFSIDDQGGLISGVVGAAMESDARAVVAEVQKTMVGRLPLRIDLKVDPKLNFVVLSLTQGGADSSATLLQRGKAQTFRVGEPVFGVGELIDIKVDGVVLALGRREIFIPLVR